VLADSDSPKGQVIAQDPAAGATVDEGSRVTITVSRGPKKVRVPEVVGQDRSSATATLRDAGLSVRVVERESESDDEDTVIRQSPPGGTSVNEGTSVTIFVAVPPEEPAGPGVDPDDEGDGGDGGTGGSPGVDPNG
jgi:serine/threonine-protein kinase